MTNQVTPQRSFEDIMADLSAAIDSLEEIVEREVIEISFTPPTLAKETT